MPIFHVVASSHFARDLKRLAKRNPDLLQKMEVLKIILEQDPHNITKRFNIKKLSGIKPGRGEWRIRFGDYHLRYDIFGREVVLYVLRHRKDVYF